MSADLCFYKFFQTLWSHTPFPWQHMLAERLAEDNWPQALDLPTASGKTACIDIAIYALAAQACKPVWERTAPRRIWFVVDRRIVVDEAFERAANIAEKLHRATDGPLKTMADCLREVSGTERPLAVGRLRGGVLRDDGWARLPSQPAVITSTVDQLGSRLLFRGYGHSALTAPIFAGLAAHDSLILLDEAHLSVPFMQTLRAVERYRGEDWAEQPIRTPFAFSILSATPPPDIPESAVFPGADRNAALDHPELARRMKAAKPAELLLIKGGKSSAQDPLVDIAVERAAACVKKQDRRRVAVIVNRVATAEAVAQAMRGKHDNEIDIVLLTGRLRPFERDQLVALWKPLLKANEPTTPERPVVLVTTQCIEVGADFSFDALVTEAASLDALRQRFGRLNRLGMLDCASAFILIRDEDAKDKADDFVYGTALARCWRLLEELAQTEKDGEIERKIIDFAIGALDARLQEIDDLTPYLAPTSDAPLLLPSHVDLLCQTSFRPHVEPDIQLYLHGMDRGTPEVRVAWRADLNKENRKSWLETVALCPPNSGETALVPLFRLRRWLADETTSDDDSDVEGSRDSDSHSGQQIRPVLLWRGRERSQIGDSASQLSPNDVVVLPAAYGMAGLAQSAPGQAVGNTHLDIWEPSHAQSGKPFALRVHRKVLEPWLKCPPLLSLMEIAETPDWEYERMQEAIDAVLAYTREGEDPSSALPEWWLTLLKQVRDGRYEQHPAGGLVIRARKAESQAEGEQDLFADDDDLLSAIGQEVTLNSHSASVERAVDQLASRCLADEFREPLKTAAYWHDVGKLDERFQVMLRQGNELAALAGEPLAKSVSIPDSPARRQAIRSASGLPEKFRHEMLSLQLTEFFLPNGEDTVLDDLLHHAIASHHGYGRPFAPISLDPEPPSVRYVHGGTSIEANTDIRAGWPAPHALNSGVTGRFWHLTRRYGWWGLAYLETVLRLGDWYGSRWTLGSAPDESQAPPTPSRSKVAVNGTQPLVLEGIDGANPLGFLAAVGTLSVLYQSGYRESQLAWQRNGLFWRPLLYGLPTNDQTALSNLLEERLGGASTAEESDKRRKEAEQQFSRMKKEIKDKRDEIKNRGLRGKERKQALEEEIAPLEDELESLRKTWLEALRQSVPRPELALGKKIDCTASEYRAITEPLLEKANFSDRESLDLLAAFCSTGCLHGRPTKRKSGKLEPTPFSFISGSGHQHFLDTAGMLMRCVSAELVDSTLFKSWTYEDPGFSMRWDPAEDRRYALMDRGPKAADNKPRTIWMANLLAYRALALFPSAPAHRDLATVGWARTEDGEPIFTWPIWTFPLDPDSIRSLLLLPELHLEIPEMSDRAAMRTRGVKATFRSRRIKVGSGTNFKINFTPTREI